MHTLYDDKSIASGRTIDGGFDQQAEPARGGKSRCDLMFMRFMREFITHTHTHAQTKEGYTLFCRHLRF